MPSRHRKNGVPFTCMNRQFETDDQHPKSKPHAPLGAARGSVFDAALVNHPGGYSLWLEYVTDRAGNSMFWLMWYDQNGDPTIPASGVFDIDQMKGITRGLQDFFTGAMMPTGS